MSKFGELTRGLVANRNAAAALEYSIIVAVVAMDMALIFT
jgi:Flp pilus assembly pilin Flp